MYLHLRPLNILPYMLRNCLLLLGVALALFTNAQTNEHRIVLDPTMKPFYHGVESGDPAESQVIIWTRVTPDTGMVGNVDVFWQIATDTNFTNIVNYGKVVATDAEHYCVKVDVCNLQPSTYYYYMFNALGRNSIMGRTKTAPAANADPDNVRFGVVSCASWEHGYFNAYESLSRTNNIDAVVHLGDYIYEYAAGDYGSNISGRSYEPPTETVTEVGYELRYSQYKLDKQLQRIHQLYPFITVWDDHETANDAWKGGAENHSPGTEGSYADRKYNSTNTYFKWMPLRKPDPLDTIRIFRKLRYGKLLDLIMLDTRLYDRDEQDASESNDSTHHLLGPVEMAWFTNQLADTATRWKIIGNQVMFAPLEVFGSPVNNDQWDGYNYERQQVQNFIMNNNVKDVVILTGDIHTSWANDVPGANYNSNTGAGSVCVEFVGSSVTSANSPLPVGSNIIKSLNPHMKYIDLSNKGYYVLDVMKTKAQADYTYVSTVSSLGATNVQGPSYYVNDNERFLRQGTAVTNAPVIPAPMPPLNAKQGLPFNKIDDHYIVINENTQTTVSIIPSMQMCPQVSLSLLSPAQHGGTVSLNGMDVTYVPTTNYGGTDTVVYLVCTNEPNPVCDTVTLYITVNAVRDIDTLTVSIGTDTTVQICVSYDDLVYAAGASTYSLPHHGTVNAVNDTCFSYTPDGTYRGVEWIIVSSCDTAGNCDTVVVKIKIATPISASVENIELPKNSNVTHCLVFDDLPCSPSAISVLRSPANGTYQIVNGNCIKYSPYYNYVGLDTVVVTGCDTCNTGYCDTVYLVFNTTDATGIKDESKLVVFAMFPNPTSDKLVVQYYLYEASNVTFNVYDVNGRLISTDEFYQTDMGLKYAQLNTTVLPVGTYVVEVKAGANTFRKQIVKQ